MECKFLCPKKGKCLIANTKKNRFTTPIKGVNHNPSHPSELSSVSIYIRTSIYNLIPSHSTSGKKECGLKDVLFIIYTERERRETRHKRLLFVNEATQFSTLREKVCDFGEPPVPSPESKK